MSCHLDGLRTIFLTKNLKLLDSTSMLMSNSDKHSLNVIKYRTMKPHVGHDSDIFTHRKETVNF